MPRKPKKSVPAAVPVVLGSASPFEPTKLDPILQDAKGVLEEAMAQWRMLSPLAQAFRETLQNAVQEQIGGALSADEAHNVMQSLTGMMERQARTTVNMAKAVDTVARLRTFLAGGIPETPELTGKSDRELEQIIRAAAGAIG